MFFLTTKLFLGPLRRASGQKGFSNLEPEGQGHGIVIGVTLLLLLEPFYTIQTQTPQTFLGGVYLML